MSIMEHLGVISTITLCTVTAGCRASSASFHTLLVHPREHCYLVKMQEAPSPTDRDVEPPSPAPEAAERQQQPLKGAESQEWWWVPVSSALRGKSRK